MLFCFVHCVTTGVGKNSASTDAKMKEFARQILELQKSLESVKVKLRSEGDRAKKALIEVEALKAARVKDKETNK